MGRGGIANYKLGLCFAVLKEIGNPFGLHQPADEVEIAFSILGTIVARWVLTDQSPGNFQSPVAVQDLFQDVWHGLTLEDTVLHPLSQQPELRHECSPVANESILAISRWHSAFPLKLLDDSV